MLTYGLKYALDALADNLSERNYDVVQIVAQVQSVNGCRYPQTVEHNIYRVVQEACENALKYAQARSIQISGELSPSQIELQVSDDGLGFKDGISLHLDEMIANKHYGLAGMHERAELIGATIRIQSEPKLGTRIQVVWKSTHS
jgi:signal transduction histidine kinase